MTPNRDDAEIRFAREGLWPRPPTALQALAQPEPPSTGVAAIRFEPLADEDGRGRLWFAARRPGFAPAIWAANDGEALVPAPMSRAIGLRPSAAPVRRRGRRLIPLIGAASVGVGGLLALFLLIGAAPERPTASPVPADRLAASTLAAADPVLEAAPGGIPGGR